jgi:hypothetical protein
VIPSSPSLWYRSGMTGMKRTLIERFEDAKVYFGANDDDITSAIPTFRFCYSGHLMRWMRIGDPRHQDVR